MEPKHGGLLTFGSLSSTKTMNIETKIFGKSIDANLFSSIDGLMARSVKGRDED